MRLDVLFDYQVFTQQEYGGVSRYVVELARHLRQIPQVSATIYGGRHYNSYLEASRSEIPVKGHRVPRSSSRALHLMTLARNESAFLLYALGKRVTHIHRTYYYHLLDPVTRATNVLTVYDMIHELFPSHFSMDPTSSAKRRAVASADHIICISESTRRDLMRFFGVSGEKCTAIPLGLSSSIAEIIAAGHLLRRAHERPYMLYVGVRRGYKNFDTLLQAYAAVPGLREGIDLVCFGGGPFRAEELSRMAELGIRSDRVRQLAGPDELLASAYRHAEFFVYPSFYEGFGFPPLEAMALGCPVGCSNTGSMPEVVGNAAILFDPASVDDIARTLGSLASDSSLREACRGAGLIQAAKFTWKRCAELTRDVYARTC